MGARGCEASPFESLVVEDAPTGIKAGKAAGCRVLATCTSHTAEELEKEKPDFLVEDLSHVTAKWNNETKTFRLVIEQPVGRKTPVATPDATPVITPAMSRASSFASQMSRSEYFKPSDDLTGADSVFGSPLASRAGSPGPEDESGSGNLSRKPSYKQTVPGGVSLDQFKRALAGSTDKRRPSIAQYTEATDAPQQQ